MHDIFLEQDPRRTRRCRRRTLITISVLLSIGILSVGALSIAFILTRSIPVPVVYDPGLSPIHNYITYKSFRLPEHAGVGIYRAMNETKRVSMKIPGNANIVQIASRILNNDDAPAHTSNLDEKPTSCVDLDYFIRFGFCFLNFPPIVKRPNVLEFDVAWWTADPLVLTILID